MESDSCSPAEGESPVDMALAEAQNHIARIRSEKFDGREGQELAANAKTVISALAMCASISQTLNSQPTHFLLEFIQNADDNSYVTDVVPSLSISCCPGYCKIDCNEIGFQLSNVEAICNIGQSTKINRPGSIGEKGIGFKSVFKIAKSVWVCSNSYSFKFERDALLGMVAPAWADFPDHVFGTRSLAELPASSSSFSAGTQFMLQLDDGKQAYAEKTLYRQLHRLHSDSVLLLFLRNLRQIQVSIDDLSGRPQGKFLNTIARQDYHEYGGEMIRIRNVWTTNRTRRAGEELSDEYFVVRHLADNMPKETTRMGIGSSEVVLAFPFQRGQPTFHRQKAYAFLPIRESGFRFLLQADFVLIANREAIQAPVASLEINDASTDAPTQASTKLLITHDWNWRLLEALADCFVKAVSRFNHPDAQVLRYTWLGFLQDVPIVAEDNPFSFITSHIFDRLKMCAVLETQTQGGLLVQPTKALYVPRYLRDSRGHFVLAHVVGLTDQHYVSSGYDFHDPEQVVLKLLGVQIMDFDKFFTILKDFMSKSMSVFVQQPPDFHSMISTILYDSPSNTELDTLALIPLRDGRWVRQLDGQSYFATEDVKFLQELPEGIDDLWVVDAAVSQDPSRRKLFTRLGLKDLTKAEVCRLIIARHGQDSAPATSVDVLVDHAIYLFKTSRDGISIKKPQQFWVLDIDGHPRQAGTMYFDAVDMPICGILPRPAWNRKLLHPAYALRYPSGKNKEKWVKWLESNLDVGLAMRIAQSGNAFTEEFLYAIDLSTVELLDIMVSSWLNHASAFSSTIKNMLGAIQVTCENGQRVRLSKSILPTRALKLLAVEGLPYLQINDPDGSKWKFLKELGVVVGPDLEFHMKCLELLQGKPTTRERTAALYGNVFSHVIENTKRVTDYFSSPNKAIYVPHAQRWVLKSECVWGSSAGVTGAHDLSGIYPMLQSFFIHHLNVSTASIDKVITELMSMVGSIEETLTKRKQLLFSMSDFLRKRPQDYVKLQQKLTDKPIMPIMAKFGLKATDVRSLNKATWLFADRHHYFESFRDQPNVSFADFSVEQYPRLEPLSAAILNAWGPRADHCLSRLVAESREQGGQTVRSIAGTEFLRSKVKYLRRITRASLGNKGLEMGRKLDMLHNVNVYSAPHMVISPSLIQGQLGRPVEGKPIPAKVYLKECGTQSKQELQVYVRPQTSDRLPLSELSTLICLFCGVREEKLQTVVKDVMIEEDARDIDDLLSRAKIDGYDDYDYEAAPVQPKPDIRNVREDAEGAGQADKSVGEAVREPNGAHEDLKRPSSSSETITASSDLASEGLQPLRDITNQRQSLGDNCRGSLPTLSPESSRSKPIKQLYLGFSTSSTLPEPCHKPPSPSRETVRPFVDAASNQSTRQKANGQRRPPVFDQQPIARTGRGPQITLTHVRDVVGLQLAAQEAREERVGIQGELKVFRTLQNVLGGEVKESCWTSELRELAGDEFSRWMPEDLEAVYCDFTVQDVEGSLAAWLVREGFPVPDCHGSLTYHIEVKSTAGSCNEPFHMSALQMNKCKELSVASEGWNGRDVFVVFRLYDLAQGGGLMVYVDPWTEICGGRLAREPDGWLVRDES